MRVTYKDFKGRPDYFESLFFSDGYGGITCARVDVEQDCLWDRENLRDDFDSIEDFFKNCEYPIFDSIVEAADWIELDS